MIARESPISTRSVIHHSAVENSKKEVVCLLGRKDTVRTIHDPPSLGEAVGGWDSFQAIEPYLNSPSEAVVNSSFEEADLDL